MPDANWSRESSIRNVKSPRSVGYHRSAMLFAQRPISLASALHVTLMIRAMSYRPWGLARWSPVASSPKWWSFGRTDR